MTCAICARSGDGRRHEGSVGGNLFEDEHWYAYHAPIARATAGQLFLVSKRHFLDIAEMTSAEATSYGPVLLRLCGAVKRAVRAERVCVAVTVEGIPHFHVWLIPRPPGSELRGWAYINSERSCSEADALDAVELMRMSLACPTGGEIK